MSQLISGPRLTDTDLRNASLLSAEPAPTRTRDHRRLSRIAEALVAGTDWQRLLRFDPQDRWYTRLTTGPGWEAWLLTWLPGQGTDLHDHGGSAGAFTVLTGELIEATPTPRAGEPARLVTRRMWPGDVRSFGARHIHRVTNSGGVPAASLHVYGPALTVMNRYELDPERGPVVAATERAGADW